jgi:hypothetical protein
MFNRRARFEDGALLEAATKTMGTAVGHGIKRLGVRGWHPGSGDLGGGRCRDGQGVDHLLGDAALGLDVEQVDIARLD